MTKLVDRISSVSVVSGNGAGNDRKIEVSKRAKRYYHNTVAIYEEARRLGAVEESEIRRDENDSKLSAENRRIGLMHSCVCN